VRLLIDNALSPLVASGLLEAGHDAVHVRDLISPASKDEVVLDLAATENRILVSADTDFGEILANREASKPSFVLLRPNPETIAQQTAALVLNLPLLERDLARGCVAVIEGFRVRIRHLPIREPDND
jgi:predicted nuclease of predicted toxin-antitoxin system